MTLLVRKITRSKWPAVASEGYNIDNLKADAITSCLRTSSDTLSTWEVSDADSIKEAVLALASGFDSLDTIHVIAIEEQKIINSGLQINPTKGLTIVDDLKNSHKDITGLTLQSLSTFATIVIEAIREDNVHRFTKTDLTEILTNAVKSGRLKKDLLKDKVRSKIGA